MIESEIKNLYGGFVTAARTLSILPVPGRESRSMASSLPWFPIVGALLGFIVYGCAALASFLPGLGQPALGAFIALAAGVVLTRGLHLDGLSDWADGFGGFEDRARVLEIMKDSRVGAFGVLALVLALLGKWAATSGLFEFGDGVWLVGAYIVSRAAMVELAATLPYARPGGGTAASFVSGAGPAHRLGSLVIALVLLLVMFGWRGPLLLAAGLGAAKYFGLSCRKRLGGVTGDLLGAGSEITELTSLLLAAVLIGMG